MPMRMGVFSSLRRANGSRYDTTDLISAACGDREPNARVAPTAPRHNALPRHPIRREEKESRDTTFRQGGTDYGWRYGHWAGNCHGVCAGGRKPDRGGTKIGKTARGD